MAESHRAKEIFFVDPDRRGVIPINSFHVPKKLKRIIRKKKSIKIGFTFLTPEYWGSYTNLQIKTLMLGYAFNYVENIYFDIGKNNIRSRKAIEKIGATLHLDADIGNVLYILRFEDLKVINLGVIDEIKKNRSMEAS